MWWIYLFSVCDGLKIALGILTGLFVVMLIVVGIGHLCALEDGFEDEIRTTRRFINKAVIGLAITVPLLVFIPSKRTCAEMITAGSVIDYVKNNEHVREIPDKVVDIALNYLDRLEQRSEQAEEEKKD